MPNEAQDHRISPITSDARGHDLSYRAPSAKSMFDGVPGRGGIRWRLD